MHGKGRLVALSGIGLLLVLTMFTYGRGLFARQTSVAEHLPANPMIAGVYTVHPLEKLDAWLKRMQTLTGETLDPWAELDEKAGMSFRDDVLGAFGPEFGFALELPELESKSGGLETFDKQMPRRILERSVLVTAIANREGVIRAAGALARLAEAELNVDEDRLTFTIKEASMPDGVLVLHARVMENLLVVSGSSERVDEAGTGFDAGQRLADGADFAHVVTQVEADPDSLTYFNLPRIRDWIRAAGLDASMGRMQALLEDDWMGVGLIHTSRRSGAGVQVSQFGPAATAEGLGMLWSGAYMIPMALMSPLGRLASGSQAVDGQGTMGEMRTIGTALEAYAIDQNSYPSTTGWEDLSSLRSQLEPAYLRVLPTHDEWNQPYRVWSDGTTYRLVSGGADATVERDWTGEVEFGGFTDPASDLVFGDGQFLRWPQR